MNIVTWIILFSFIVTFVYKTIPQHSTWFWNPTDTYNMSNNSNSYYLYNLRVKPVKSQEI